MTDRTRCIRILNATLLTPPECPSSVRRAAPVFASQSLTIWSYEADATSWQFDEIFAYPAS
jgi:hypothetical protein